MENKIKEILSNRADYYIDSNGKSHDIIRGHPDDIMDEIVKLFAIPDVVGRSEQLKAFVRWVKANDRHIVDGDFGLIDDYLKSL